MGAAMGAVARTRVRLVVVTLAAVLALLLLLPVSVTGGETPRCTSLLGNQTACDTAGQNLSVVVAFAAAGLLWWLSGSRKLPPLRRR